MTRGRIGVVVLLLMAGTVCADQQYHTDPIDTKSRAYGANAKQWLANPAAYTADKAHFDEYFNKYYFPDMTKADEADLGRLGESRFNLFKRFLWATNNAELQQDLTEMAFQKMKSIVTSKGISPPYHPAVRYNALLVIGLLDKQYSTGGSGAKPPVPLPEANSFLTLIVNYGADDKPVPPTFVLGAVIGLDRHMQFREGLPPEAVTAMTAALLKLATHDKPIQEMDPEAYAWIRMRAAGALAKLGTPGDGNSIHNAIIKLITGSKSLDDRCEIAGMLERIKYKGAKLDDAGTADPLFGLARDVATAEDKRAQDFQNQHTSGYIGPRVRVEGPGSVGGVEDQETYPRRQVLARLTGVRAALTAVKPALSDETQKKVDAVVKAIDAAKTAAQNKDTAELKLAESIRSMAAAVNSAVPGPKDKLDKGSKAAAKASASN